MKVPGSADDAPGVKTTQTQALTHTQSRKKTLHAKTVGKEDVNCTV